MLCLLMAGASPAWAGPAHEHGVARLDVGVEAGRLSLQLETPLDNLLGFERAPRTEAERGAAAAAVAQLRDAARLFRVDGAAACRPEAAELTSAALGLGAAAADPKDPHAELAARYDFHCQGAAPAAFVEHRLFEWFPRLNRIELQLATPRGQHKSTLRRPSARIVLAR
jgi:hypothetical protein